MKEGEREKGRDEGREEGERETRGGKAKARHNFFGSHSTCLKSSPKLRKAD